MLTDRRNFRLLLEVGVAESNGVISIVGRHSFHISLIRRFGRNAEWVVFRPTIVYCSLYMYKKLSYRLETGRQQCIFLQLSYFLSP